MLPQMLKKAVIYMSLYARHFYINANSLVMTKAQSAIPEECVKDN